MRHLARGGSLVLGGRKQLLATSGVAAIASLAGIYLLAPPVSAPLPDSAAHAISLTLDQEE